MGLVGSVAVGIAVYAVAEAAWLFSMRSFYAPRFSRIARDGALRIRSALAIALLYPLLLGVAVALIVRPTVSGGWGWMRGAWLGALLGAAVYGVYNLTNMATLPGWSWDLVAVDTCWGAASMALFCAVSLYALKRS